MTATNEGLARKLRKERIKSISCIRSPLDGQPAWSQATFAKAGYHSFPVSGSCQIQGQRKMSECTPTILRLVTVPTL